MSEEKKDYSCTLNLPKTDFPMRGNLPTKEPETLKAVFENGLYEKILKKNEGHKHFVLHDGPPYANGEIHAGHALNKILKDTIVRYKAMKGFYAPFIPGYDTHGMPTEKKAIEKLGLDRSKIPVTKFRDTCREFTTNYKDIQTEGFKRLGVLGDWAHPYITYDHATEARQIGVFGDMYKKGYIYKGLKPVYWCTDCETALAEAELEYKDVTGESIYVKFPVEDSKGLFDKKDTYMVIWTTTPWTLPGNMGITIGADYEYSMVELKENKENSKLERLIIATELVEKVMKLAEVEDYKTVQTFKGSELEGVLCKHPFLDRMSRVVLGSETTVNVTLDEGTGAVHTAPAYGKEDYLQGLKDKLGMVVAVDDKGKQTAEAGEFAGQFYAKSNKTITAWLDENGYLLKAVKIEHSYPHCWRCKKPIIFRATPQWFASVDGFRDDVLKAIKTVTWHPDWGEDRMSEMIKGRNDWCISRQRTWGVPIPIFYCEKCGKEYINDETISKVKEMFEKEGSGSWFEKTPEEILGKKHVCECGCDTLVKEKDIMDVWFDSGSSHVGVLNENYGLPEGKADMYLEGNDQYRGWFQSSLLTSVATKGEAPYKEVVTHGMVVDGEGRKMSKSLGNGIAPLDIVNEYGADILRLWATSSDYHSEMRLSKDILKQISEVYKKIRNTVRFLIGNTNDFDPKTDYVEYKDRDELDRYIMYKLNKLVEYINEAYSTYEYHLVYSEIHRFCTTELSSKYLDVIKDRLYTFRIDHEKRRSSQSSMYDILYTLTRLISPILVFTSEEIYSFMNTRDEKKESILLEDFPSESDMYIDDELITKWNRIFEIKESFAKDVEAARADKKIGSALDAKITIYTNGEEYDFVKNNQKEIALVAIVSEIEVEKSDEKKVVVEKATGEKCPRCWTYANEFSDEGICMKCYKNM